MGKVNLGISQDGYAWANKELPGTSPGGPGGMGQYVVGYGANDWLVALSSGNWAAGPRIFRSSDAGETWNELIDVSFSDSFSGWPSEPLVYAQGAWFLSSGSWIYASSDRGSTWTRRPSFWSPSSPSITLIGQANDVLFARGIAGTLFYSTDGAMSWTQAPLPGGMSHDIQDVAFGNGMYMAITSGGGVLTSSHYGSAWTQTVSGTSAWGPGPAPGAGGSFFSDVTFGNGIFILSDGKTSTDGVFWTSPARWIPQNTGAAPPAQQPSANFAYGPGGFVGVTTSAPDFGAIIQPVNGVVPTLSPSSTGEIVGEIGIPLSHTFYAPGATGYALSSVPPGLTFDSSSGTLSGTPSELACRYLVVYAINSAGGSDPVIVEYSAQNSGGSAVAPLHFVSRWAGATFGGAFQKVMGGPSTYWALPNSVSPTSSINLKKSPDGIAWVDNSLWFSGAGGPASGLSPFLVEGSGQWLAAFINPQNNNDLILRTAASSDPGSWQEIPGGPSFPGTFSGWGRSLNGLVYGDGKWFLFGWLANSGGDHTLWVSEDNGATWTNRSPAGVGSPVASVNSFAIGGGIWVATTDQGRVLRSADSGLTWSLTSFSGSPNFVGLAYGNNRFLLAASDGTVWTSTDGAASWVQQLAPYPVIWWLGSNQLSSVTFGGGLFLLSDGRSSADGVRWTSAARWIPQTGLGGVLPRAGAGSVSLAHGPAGFLASLLSGPAVGPSDSHFVYQSVSAGVPSWSSGPVGPEKAQWGLPFNRTFQATGATSYQAFNLPDGLSLDSATGTISGVPVNPSPITGPMAPAPGNQIYSMVLYASNSFGLSDARTYTLELSQDITPPVITLLGDNPMTIYKRSMPGAPPGSGFTDPGAQVTDDQDVPRTIYGMSAINDNMVGTYTITYSTSDSYGNAATPVIRTVNVVLDPALDEDGDGLTNGQETTLGTNPSQKDSDNDGVNDPVELADETDPADASDFQSRSLGLLAYYPLAGNANDASGNGRNGVPETVTLVANRKGNAGEALGFNGSTSRVVVGGSWPNGYSDRTVTLWFRGLLPDQAGNLFTFGDSSMGSRRFSVLLRSDGLYFCGEGNDQPLGGAVSQGSWHFLAITMASGTIAVYLDESLLSSFPKTLDTSGGMPLVMGSNSTARNDEYFTGDLDEVRVFDRALSSAEINAIYFLDGQDIQPPAISLIGPDPMEVYKGSVFIDPGATVTDNKDAPRTIYGIGEVDTSVVATYTLHYEAWDAAGNLAVPLPVTRTVNVVLNPAGDEDGDGLGNGQETLLGSDPLVSDSNGDGIGDGRAYSLGLSPTLNLTSLLESLKTNPVAGLYNQSQFESNRNQGREDVTTNPAAYNLVTQVAHEANRIAGRNDVMQAPNSYNLYQTNQIRDMSIGKVLLMRTNDGFILNYQVEQSEDLIHWVPYQVNQVHITNVPADKMFLRVRASE